MVKELATESGAPRSIEPAATPERPSRGVKGFLLGARRLHLVLIAILSLAVVVLGAWVMIERSRTTHDLARQRAALTERARAALVAQTHELLALSGRPLAWALRTQLLAGGRGDLESYMAEGVVTLTLCETCELPLIVSVMVYVPAAA